ncbi:MAG: hypothetical protein V3R69_00865 [candidate division NC10 bacterium]
MTEVGKGEAGVPSEAGDIWLASGRGPAAEAQRRRGWPASAHYNASACVTLPRRKKSPENNGAAEEGPSEPLVNFGPRLTNRRLTVIGRRPLDSRVEV